MKPANGKIGDCVEKTMRRYFKDLNGEDAGGVYQMVLDEVEAPLFREVMRCVDNNQSRAAKILGLNRSTLRKKLARHGII